MLDETAVDNFCNEYSKARNNHHFELGQTMTLTFVKLKLATERLGVTGRVLRYWDAKGVIATVRTLGGTRLFDVDGYLAKKATEQRRRTELFGRPLETIRDATDDVMNDKTPPVAATSSLDAWKMEIDAVFKSVHEKSKNNTSEFFIHFGKAAEWIRFSQKCNAKRHLLANFEEGIDFTIRGANEHDIFSEHGNAEQIYLTGDCFKNLCMSAHTERVNAYVNTTSVWRSGCATGI
ncbi:hypothetical protein CYMTET_26782 [Cymbomonas tetramitiformis]|uniref:HTH merR-type domain-containing protein n=1 Tax=Cymbomonas tetramitiformis TaxID=36881 RepID=A0AAE0KXN2_9CHLO|nr:hypothetical protein CYMTET_26782 [Cymbomonas tetramitiformis]